MSRTAKQENKKWQKEKEAGRENFSQLISIQSDAQKM